MLPHCLPATSWIDGATFLHLLSPLATLYIPSGPPGLVVLSGPLKNHKR